MQADIQTYSQTGRQAGRQRYRHIQANRQPCKHRKTYSQTDRHTDRQTDKHTARQADTHTHTYSKYRQQYRHRETGANKLTNRHRQAIHGQAGRQADRQPD